MHIPNRILLEGSLPIHMPPNVSEIAYTIIIKFTSDTTAKSPIEIMGITMFHEYIP